MYIVRFHFACTSVVAILNTPEYELAINTVAEGQGAISFTDERGIRNSVATRNVTYVSAQKIPEENK